MQGLPGSLTDAQARSVVIKSLRNSRAAFRKADTAGEKVEREMDRLIKRKTRMNASSLTTLNEHYKSYNSLVDNVQKFLTDAYVAAALF